MTDWSRASLTDTADAIACGATTSRDVVEACLDRISRLDPQLHAFVAVDPNVRAAADAADRARRAGRKLGPLHGVPLAHKDMYYRVGRTSASIVR